MPTQKSTELPALNSRAKPGALAPLSSHARIMQQTMHSSPGVSQLDTVVSSTSGSVPALAAQQPSIKFPKPNNREAAQVPPTQASTPLPRIARECPPPPLLKVNEDGEEELLHILREPSAPRTKQRRQSTHFCPTPVPKNAWEANDDDEYTNSRNTTVRLRS